MSEKNNSSKQTKSSNYKTGITFSGGAARGYAHIGILRALLENDMEPDIISGTSMGAIVGVLYAAGYGPEEIQDILTRDSVFNILGFSWNKQGLFKVKNLRKALEAHIPEDDFSALKKPFYVMVSNLTEGKKEVKSSGPLFDFIVAACSVPAVFAPQVIDGVTYVDGGLLSNLPAKPIREKCEKLIGANVNYMAKVDSFGGTKEVLERALLVGVNQNIKPDVKLCDVYIDPPEMQKFSLLDFGKTEEIIEAGYTFTMKEIASGNIQ